MFLTHTPMCVSTVNSGYFPESREQKYSVNKISCSSGGIRTRDPWSSRAVCCQLGYRRCPITRGSLSPNVLAAGKTKWTIKKLKNANLIWWKNIKGYAPEVSGIQAPVQLMAHTGPSPLPYRTLQDLHPTQSTSPPASNPSHRAGPVPLGEKARQIPITLSHQGQQKALNLY